MEVREEHIRPKYRRLAVQKTSKQFGDEYWLLKNALLRATLAKNKTVESGGEVPGGAEALEELVKEDSSMNPVDMNPGWSRIGAEQHGHTIGELYDQKQRDSETRPNQIPKSPKKKPNPDDHSTDTLEFIPPDLGTLGKPRDPIVEPPAEQLPSWHPEFREKSAYPDPDTFVEVPPEIAAKLYQSRAETSAQERGPGPNDFQQIDPKIVSKLRGEEYVKRFELRDEARRFRIDRIRLADAEHHLDETGIRRANKYLHYEHLVQGEGLSEKTKLHFIARLAEHEKGLAQAEREYIALRKEYEVSRAGLVGAKAWRTLEEKTAREVETGRGREGGKFDAVRKSWRWFVRLF